MSDSNTSTGTVGGSVCAPGASTGDALLLDVGVGVAADTPSVNGAAALAVAVAVVDAADSDVKPERALLPFNASSPSA